MGTGEDAVFLAVRSSSALSQPCPPDWPRMPFVAFIQVCVPDLSHFEYWQSRCVCEAPLRSLTVRKQ